MNNDEKKSLPSLKCTIEHNESDSKWKYGTAAVVGAAVLGGAAVYSPPAHAGIGGILNSLVSKFRDMFEPLLNGVFGNFSDILNLNSNQNAAKTINALSLSSDGIVSAISATEEHKLRLATAPPPDYCASDELGLASNAASESTKAAFKRLASESSAVYQDGTSATPYSVQIRSLAQKYSSPDKRETLLSIGHQLQSSKLTDPKAVIDALDLMTSHLTDSIDLNPALANGNAINQKQFMSSSAQAVRLEIAKAPFLSAIAEKSPGSDGHSEQSLIEEEIRRTYGGRDHGEQNLANKLTLLHYCRNCVNRWL